MDRNTTIEKIRKAIKDRSGKTWSVKGDRGTAWGWIDISSPPRRLVNGSMTEEDRKELADLLGLTLSSVGSNGVSIGASTDYRLEYIDRAEGRTPAVAGTPYWD